MLAVRLVLGVRLAKLLWWYSHHAQVLPLLGINQGKQCPHSLLGKRSPTINGDCLTNNIIGREGEDGWGRSQTRERRDGDREGLTLGSYPMWCALHIWKKTGKCTTVKLVW